MTFLYAGLGIIMISGIAAMMQVANNVSKFNVISGIKPDKYIKANLAKYDRRLLNIINNPIAPKSDICNYVIAQTEIQRESLKNAGLSKAEIDREAPIYFDSVIVNNQKIPNRTLSKDERIIGSCVLLNTDLKHRVLINKNNSKNRIYNFSLFSCHLDKAICNFEENK